MDPPAFLYRWSARRKPISLATVAEVAGCTTVTCKIGFVPFAWKRFWAQTTSVIFWRWYCVCLSSHVLYSTRSLHWFWKGILSDQPPSYSHLQNRLRPLLLKKLTEHRPHQPFLALTLFVFVILCTLQYQVTTSILEGNIFWLQSLAKRAFPSCAAAGTFTSLLNRVLSLASCCALRFWVC
jgi:hypothetical protein